jgi:hypothetical protein
MIDLHDTTPHAIRVPLFYRGTSVFRDGTSRSCATLFQPLRRKMQAIIIPSTQRHFDALSQTTKAAADYHG